MIKLIRSGNFAFGSYLELAKPRIVVLILVTTAIGFYLGSGGSPSWLLLIVTLLGTGLSAAGAGALNHYLERSADARMVRTKDRPLPTGRVKPLHAMVYGLLLVAAGGILLIQFVNLLTALLALLTTLLYTVVYTPMKRHSWLNTSIGAIPGALPIMGGWTAAAGDLSGGAWILFAIMFLWQHPHFYSIAWMFRDEYRNAGFKMLSGIDHSGRRTAGQILTFLIALLPVSLLPMVFHVSGLVYTVGAGLAGIWLVQRAIPFIREKTQANALVILKSTIWYLPVILTLIVVDSRL